MTFPLVSICIPTYNRSAYLREAIDSSLAMDYPNLEVVVSDNASTDNTRQIIKEINDDRVKYFRNDVNVGGYENFRKVLYEYARGDYAIYLADDNYFVNTTYIAKAIDLILKNDGVNIVFSNWRCGDNGVFNDISLQLSHVSPGMNLLKAYFPEDATKVRMPLMFYSAVFKRELAVNIDAVSPECLEVDVPFMLKIAAQGNVGFINIVSVVQRIHSTNASVTLPLDVWYDSMFKIGNELRDALSKDEVEDKLIREIKLRSDIRERNTMFGKALYEVSNRRLKLVPFLVKFMKKLYREDPVLIAFIIKPRILAQLIIALLNPSVYFFMRRKFGSNALGLTFGVQDQQKFSDKFLE